MPQLTALILAAFVAYAGAWYLGFIEGNFELLLLMATLVTAVYWMLDKLVFAPRRRGAAQALDGALRPHVAEGANALDAGGDLLQARQRRVLAQPWWLDWTAGLFPVIFIVFLLRSFVFEPFKIPSGSMIPTLLIGDLILVNKYTYGLKLPVVDTKLTQGRDIERGEVIVFRYPVQPSVDYIKRVVGVPGDEVAYLNKRLTINGEEVAEAPLADFLDESTMQYFSHYQETLGGRTHEIIVNDQVSGRIGNPGPFPQREHCDYRAQGVVCTVPEGSYFVMGDNRDNSLDSRYWGFVPRENVVGKAFLVWMNFGHLGRIGTTI